MIFWFVINHTKHRSRKHTQANTAAKVIKKSLMAAWML